MVDVETPPERKTPDRTTRSAALWATAIAVPVALLAGVLAFGKIAPHDDTGAQPSPSATVPASVPSTPVRMAAPKLDARTTQVCLAVTSQLPATLRGMPARKVSAGPEQNAAYGEPPITVACGITQPTMCERVDGGHPGCVPLDATMFAMNGMCWWGADGPAADVFTTMDREVAVQVTVPGSYQQTAQWANEFSDAVVKTVKSTTTGVPSGCRQ
ncbi:hypothetical protein GCM10010172_20160 [Paractinoplanes ferrugineus]|uniref:DUF3515 domain-containing protein n=1 Tax=Paractinoplanes ferrugineus TaxID=113564 RepID=A0A919IXF5_9ACTN|nr:DUF3515 family protein [Actinoplanes ferrugineus]GIE09073.1 hypothetical protein Afe05nite_09130 [Actinoplanes ferrugineus]